MAAASSSVDSDLMVIDDLNVVAVALYHGRNPDDATGPLTISDEEYAAELQLQEVIVSSAMAAVIVSSAMAATASQPSVTPLLHSVVSTANNDAAGVEMPSVAVVECCPSSSTSPPALAAPAAAGEGTSATSTPTLAAVAEVCKICLEHVLPADALRASSRGCAHAFCAACLDRYISARNQDGVSDVKCPGEDCRSVLDPELCQGIISRETFEGWCAALCMSVVRRDSDVCYCPFKDCSEIMVDDHGGEVTESECPVCRRLFCARCGVPWHAGITCEEYGQLAPGDRGKEDLVVLEMAKGKKWRRCPCCKFVVERHDGCVHITCRCGFEFCYACGEPWGQSDHSSCNTG